ncbi:MULTISPECIES: phosphoenolpyruvate--protein phosphotransferase [Paenibacillus]|nr:MULTISPECIES: phosphoenolpyruvate--protein phosphotransferase [Paenibacillus]MED4606066.1 phosphoenolpyruvate--protein phosphotransferase [Paenibacillus validus]
MSHVLTGIAASPGFAIAKAVPLQAEKYVPQRRSIDDVPAETERFRKAVAEAKRELEAIRQSTEERLGPDKAEIFEGHLLLLEDPELIDAAAEQIAEQAVDAEYALYEVSQSFIEALLSLDNELLRGRAVDLQDVAGRVINHLRGVSHTTVSSLLEACIIVAEDLTPSDTAQLNLEIVRGFVTEIGSRTSHSAIMARSLDVPAIVGAGAGVHAIQAGDTVVLDALEGRIVVNPSDAELADYREKQAQYERRKAELARLKDRPTESADGHRVELAANIGSVEDVAKALENGAEAIGLFRTEFLYMGRTSLPTEEEQYNSYKHVLEKMEGKPVVIRTLDIGGDKELPYMSLPKESNPFLGLRALRLCLSREDLFRTQLRALLRASRHGQLKIMFPMISVLDELLEAKRLLQEEKEKLLREGEVVAERIEVGMMIEVPAAAIGADIFASEVDFFSIGTNDLIQYMMAADRMNETVSYLYQPCHPTVLRLVQTVIRAARREGKWVGMCGEMAGDETAIPLLLGLGLHEFSMSASSILPSRALIGTLSQREWEGLAEQALTLRSQQEVKQLVRERLSRPKAHSAATL